MYHLRTVNCSVLEGIDPVILQWVKSGLTIPQKSESAFY